MTTLLTNGFVGTATSAYVDDDEGVLYIQGYNVIENGFNLHGIKRVSRSFHVRNSKSCLQAGDLLTIQTGEIGVTTIVPPSLAGANCHALVISRLNRKHFQPDYYCHYFNSVLGRRAFKEIETGTTMKHVNVGDMKSLNLPVPGLEEQRLIGEALSDADTLIESLEQLLTKKRQIKQGAMQELLTGKRRLPGFQSMPGYKQTEVGMIPADWEVASLGEHAKFRTGPFGSSLHQSDYVDNGVPVINPMQIVDGRLLPTPSMTISEQAARRLGEFRLQAGEIVIGRRGDMGRCAVIRDEEEGWLCGTGSMIVRTGPSMDAGFAQRLLSSAQVIAAIENTSVGSTMINLNQGTLAKLRLPLPPLRSEQSAISSVLSDMDSALSALETKLTKARQLKQGMMQELLTGKIRLV
jgi:type I restriction enzyme S subunit